MSVLIKLLESKDVKLLNEEFEGNKWSKSDIILELSNIMEEYSSSEMENVLEVKEFLIKDGWTLPQIIKVVESKPDNDEGWDVDTITDYLK